MKQEKEKSSWKRYGNTVVYCVWDKTFKRYFKGVAVCQPEDEFDLNLGIKIARAKAVIKMRSWTCRVIEDRLDLIHQLKEKEPELIQQKQYWLDKVEKSCDMLNDILNKLQ